MVLVRWLQRDQMRLRHTSPRLYAEVPAQGVGCAGGGSPCGHYARGREGVSRHANSRITSVARASSIP